MSLTNGTAIVEEASTAQPIAVRQHGARLSFLGGKAKSSQQLNKEATGSTRTTGESSESNSQYGKSKENLSRIMRAQSISTNSNSNHHHRNGSAEVAGATTFPDRSRTEIVDVARGEIGRPVEGGVLRIGSVRKRLSMLKLGKKPSKYNGIAEGVDEEPRSARH